jgi:hypothetical protein
MVLGTRVIVASAVAIALALGLSSCVGGTTTTVNDSPTAAATETTLEPGNTVTSSPTPPAEPVYVPGGTAAENRPVFDATNQQYFIQAGNVIPEGRGVIDNLVSVGFDKSAMQITPDRTAIDLPVDSLVFSVLVGEECLIGQFSALGYSAIVAPRLATGSCLIGLTRTIDW